MKNTLLIDIDTERNKPVMISKPPEIAPPTTPEEAKVMIINDISCVCETLCTLIHMADQNQYAFKEDLVRIAKEQLDGLLVKENKSQESLDNSN